MTHDVVTPTNCLENRRIIKNVLVPFSAQRNLRWFISLGVVLRREETGNFFPISDKAETVSHVLIGRCQA